MKTNQNLYWPFLHRVDFLGLQFLEHKNDQTQPVDLRSIMAETLAKPNKCTPWQATLFTEPPDNETLKAHGKGRRFCGTCHRYWDETCPQTWHGNTGIIEWDLILRVAGMWKYEIQQYLFLLVYIIYGCIYIYSYESISINGLTKPKTFDFQVSSFNPHLLAFFSW